MKWMMKKITLFLLMMAPLMVAVLPVLAVATTSTTTLVGCGKLKKEVKDWKPEPLGWWCHATVWGSDGNYYTFPFPMNGSLGPGTRCSGTAASVTTSKDRKTFTPWQTECMLFAQEFLEDCGYNYYGPVAVGFCTFIRSGDKPLEGKPLPKGKSGECDPDTWEFEYDETTGVLTTFVPTACKVEEISYEDLTCKSTCDVSPIDPCQECMAGECCDYLTALLSDHNSSQPNNGVCRLECENTHALDCEGVCSGPPTAPVTIAAGCARLHCPTQCPYLASVQ